MVRALLLVLVGCSFEGRNAPAIDASGTTDAPSIDAAIDGPSVVTTVDVPCVADLYLRTDLSPDENTNDRDYVIVDGDVVAPGIFRFDLTAIPSTATVLGGELHLWVDGDDGDPMTLHRLLESWDEATATSNQRSTSVAWMGPGASPPSRGSEVVGDLSPAPVDVYVAAALDVELVASWVSSPATNFGVVLRTTNAAGARFASRERAAPNQRPFLRVMYRY